MGLRFPQLMAVRRFLTKMFGWPRISISPSGSDGRPTDPRPGVREPKRGNPGGRNAAVALMEPDEKRENVNAIGKPNLR